MYTFSGLGIRTSEKDGIPPSAYYYGQELLSARPQRGEPVRLPGIGDSKVGRTATGVQKSTVLCTNRVIEMTESIEKYDTYWMPRIVQVRQELHLYPPKSRLEEDVFNVRNPQYWRLFQ